MAPGTHHLELSMPGCAAAARDIDVWPVLPREISGRLAVADALLEGPVGAPDGGGIGFGAFTAGRAAHPGSNSLFSTSYNYDAGTIDGGYLSLSSEHRAFAFALDIRFGTQSTSGTVSGADQITGSARGPYPFTGSELSFGTALRFGGRLPLHWVALEAGSGVGADLSMATGGTVQSSNLFAPNSADGDWYVPLWVSATIKPVCNWGAQVIASYDVHPTAVSEAATSIGVGLIWQRSESCSEPPGLAVR